MSSRASRGRPSANAARDARRKGLSGPRARRYVGGSVNRAKQERRARLAGRTKPPRRKLGEMSLAERWRAFGKRNKQAQRLEAQAKAERRNANKAPTWPERGAAAVRAEKLERWRSKLVRRYVHLGKP